MGNSKSKSEDPRYKGISSAEMAKKQETSKPAMAKSTLQKSKKPLSKDEIGLPTNFQHTGHIGIRDLKSGNVDVCVFVLHC